MSTRDDRAYHAALAERRQDEHADADDYRDPDALATGGYRNMTTRQLVAERAAEGVRMTLTVCRDTAVVHGCDPMLANVELRRAMFRRIGGEGFDAEARPIVSGKAALTLAMLALRAANSAEAGRAPVQRTWLRAVLADALEALAAGDDAEAVQHIITGAAELRAKREAV